MDCVHTISCWPHAADNDLGTQGAQALAPELGKLTQLQTLNLEGEGPARRSCIRVLSADTDCVIWMTSGRGAAGIQAETTFGAEGARDLAPELGKLTKLQSLNLDGESCLLWLVVG